MAPQKNRESERRLMESGETFINDPPVFGHMELTILEEKKRRLVFELKEQTTGSAMR